MHIDWNDVQLFLAVADGGSLTAGARKLGVTQPTASRRILELESRLGEMLFVRDASGAQLTSFGERMLDPARHMFEWSVEAERVAERAETEPRGVVRLTAPPGLAYDFVAPFAALAKKKLPEIRLEVLSTVHYLDLARREADLALRMAEPTQRDLVTIAHMRFDVAPYASKAYAATLSKKCKPRDVDWIGWAPPLDHLSPNPELAKLIPGFRPSFASDDFIVQLRAAREGLGAIFLGRVKHRFSRDEGVVEIPVALPPIRGGLWIVCAKSSLEVPRVRAVADLLKKTALGS